SVLHGTPSTTRIYTPSLPDALPIWVGETWDHRRGTGMSNQLELSRGAVGEAYGIHVESHDPACVNPAGSQLHGAPSAVEEPGDGDLESFGEEVRGVAARVGVDR